MRNRSIFLIAVLAALIVVTQVTVTAQTPQAMPLGQDQGATVRTPEERAKELQKQLTLTDEQTAQVIEIYQGTYQRRVELSKSSMGDPEGSRTALQELTKKEDSEIEALLSAEQLAKYAEWKKK
ncbi:MAG: hypothetical protein MN733_14335, partial [Nitrososphaera sp.]|nr:hypothetical protein [Nitrososphaera sp.]